jgi:hypothetical protein
VVSIERFAVKENSAEVTFIFYALPILKYLQHDSEAIKTNTTTIFKGENCFGDDYMFW